jgi:hypothetical protein
VKGAGCRVYGFGVWGVGSLTGAQTEPCTMSFACRARKVEILRVLGFSPHTGAMRHIAGKHKLSDRRSAHPAPGSKCVSARLDNQGIALFLLQLDWSKMCVDISGLYDLGTI